MVNLAGDWCKVGRTPTGADPGHQHHWPKL